MVHRTPGFVVHRRIRLAVGLAVLWSASAALASPETRCQGNRHVAAGTYARCQLKAAGKYYTNGSLDVPKYQEAARKCGEVNARMLLRLQGRAAGTGSTCDGPRYVDNGNGTVTDKLTGLQWEQKTDDDTMHDKDARHSLSATGSAADGTAFTSFLAALNGACFASHCDWRLPTIVELQTILLAQYPDGGIDPLFGPLGDYYWSSTPELTMPGSGWVLSFQDGSRTRGDTLAAFNVRAVRGGL